MHLLELAREGPSRCLIITDDDDVLFIERTTPQAPTERPLQNQTRITALPYYGGSSASGIASFGQFYKQLFPNNVIWF